MKFFQKLKVYFSNLNMAQQISAVLLVVAVPLLIGLGISAFASSAQVVNAPPAVDNVEVEATPTVEPSPTAEPTPTPTPEPTPEPVVITLKPASVEEDLEVQIVDQNGNLVTGYVFQLTVEGKANYYSKVWDVDDGFLKLTKLQAGDYTVTIAPAEGYIIEEDTVECTVKRAVEYVEIDVSDKIVEESEIDVSKEEAGLAKPEATPAPTPKLPEYDNKTAEEKTEVTEYRYKAEISKGDFAESNTGFILKKDGSKSIYVAQLDKDGYIVGDIKVMPSTPAPSVLKTSFTGGTVTELESLGSVMLTVVELTEPEPTAEPTTEPTAEPTPQPTAEPTAAPTPQPTAEPTAAPTAVPTAAPTNTPAATATPEVTQAPTASPSTAPTATPTSAPSVEPTATPTATASPSASPTVAPTPTPSATPSLYSYKDGTKADIYVKNSTQLKDDVIKNLKITDASVTETKYYDGWGPGRTNYYTKKGEMIKGQVKIGGEVYDFDSEGHIIRDVAKGIDVSKYQPNINWKKVKASGVDFVIIRAGYRGYGSGVLVEDPYFKSHIEGAINAGLKVGVYFYSQAISTEEAVEEASMVLQLVKKYKLTYPVYFDTEATGTGVGRADNLSQSHRTKIANAFCKTIKNSGYKAGIYASKSWFYYQLDYNQLSQYDIWLAHYTTSTDFKYHYDMWQYTGTGSCEGVSNAVDLNWAYKVY